MNYLLKAIGLGVSQVKVKGKGLRSTAIHFTTFVAYLTIGLTVSQVKVLLLGLEPHILL